MISMDVKDIKFYFQYGDRTSINHIACLLLKNLLVSYFFYRLDGFAGPLLGHLLFTATQMLLKTKAQINIGLEKATQIIIRLEKALLYASLHLAGHIEHRLHLAGHMDNPTDSIVKEYVPINKRKCCRICKKIILNQDTGKSSPEASSSTSNSLEASSSASNSRETSSSTSNSTSASSSTFNSTANGIIPKDGVNKTKQKSMLKRLQDPKATILHLSHHYHHHHKKPFRSKMEAEANGEKVVKKSHDGKENFQRLVNTVVSQLGRFRKSQLPKTARKGHVKLRKRKIVFNALRRIKPNII